jgi:hypothetical protein
LQSYYSFGCRGGRGGPINVSDQSVNQKSKQIGLFHQL